MEKVAVARPLLGFVSVGPGWMRTPVMMGRMLLPRVREAIRVDMAISEEGKRQV